MWLLVLLATVVCANPQYTKTAYSGVKGGSTGSGYNYQYNAGENQAKFFGNNTQQGQSSYGARPSYPAYEEQGVGVCFVEVPTANLVRDPSHVPAGNGSRPDLSRIRACCKGYIRNIYNYRLCDPVCSEDCVNALCSAPETCTCFPDHVRNSAGFCIPTCPIGCQNGQCSGGECICNNGYRLDRDSKYCTPTCADNCGGTGVGNCTAPNTCTCKSGYESIPSGSCKPACTADCRNGDCVAPNDCRCKPGYVKDQSGVCGPFCAQGCGSNGRCIAPNVCNNPTTTTAPSHYQPYNPSTNQHNPLSSNPHYPNQGNYSNNPYNPDSQRPYYSNNQSNTQYGQHYPSNQPTYPGQNEPYYPTDNHQPTYNFTSDSQIKPIPHDTFLQPNNPINYTLNHPNGPNGYPVNETNSYGPYHSNQPNNYYPYNPSGQPGQYPNNPSGQPRPYPNNPSGQPGQYPNNPSGQPGQYPNNPSGQPGQYPNNPSGQPGQYPYNPSGQPGQYPNNPSGQPGQYPNNPSGQPGQHPYNPNPIYPVDSNYSNPNLPYYPTNQYPNSYDQTGNEDQIPRCSQPCINGVCVAGNRCSCNPGYELDNTDPSGTRCHPHCAGGCQNGVCSAPNFCICNMGYRKEQGVKGGSARCIKRMKRSTIQDLV